MNGALLLAAGLGLFLVRKRRGPVRWIVAGSAAAWFGFAMFEAATSFYAAGGMAAIAP